MERQCGRRMNRRLEAIRNGEVDALLIDKDKQKSGYFSESADGLYKVFVESMQEGCIVLSPAGNVLFCNDNFSDMVGLSKEQICGTSVYNYSPNTDVLDEILSLSNLKVKLEGDVLCSNGTYIPTKLSSTWVDSGLERMVCVVVTDLTQQKSDERFTSLIFEQAIEPIIICDKQVRIIRANNSALKLFGPEIINRNFNEALPLFLQSGEQLFLNKQTGVVKGTEVCLLAQDGRQYSFILTIGPMRFRQSGEYDGWVITMTNITENLRILNEMSRLGRLNLIAEMAAGIGHEVRNPMTIVRGYLQMFHRKQQFSDYKESFEIMIDELDRANGIITEFLSLAKNKPVLLSPVSLNRIIESLFPLLQADAFCQGHNVDLQLGDIPEILGDEKDLRQCLLNLVRNGLEAMKNKGIVTLVTAYDCGKVMMSVIDTGSGIPPYVMENLGTPFITTKENGTGLGLPVCYRIADRHNAKLEVETSSQGTVFRLVLLPTNA
ncbi:ATP-binding protein [Sporomusa sp.]|uniref:ATP-binding protein n=1 Tax=Sporomusa sp. TaxID=2078658 RepID=UPI002B5D0A45|nr:ATP-binding protein [Sporomusa sp.]HWR44196.1 ATP-binding protein [Sporomusa sp.]